ncbi:phage tail tip lysozyme [Crocosphaera sp. XPORK-15E]|uniref:phage tail tip lysozyme n=1 Tax=Crocosphaera sp. XPORK-15E TaxID=3110247 RepID=UPI002B206B89|nr:phage tail tip lysozyme [Crocosphaera sp. XPORK-15E]MEA5537001.1 phage tail tip lysozyme [Crocosphaera sp. XPORK-15E]
MTIPHIVLKFNDGITDTTSQVVNEVKILQKSLKDWGVLAANESIDGKFGNKTLEAVKLFQDKKSLQQDGIVGKNTWAALLKVSPSEIEIIPRSGSGNGGSGHSKSPFSGNKRLIHNELISHGFSTVQCAAILGCVQQESSFNPRAQEGPPPKGLGLFQWSFDRRNKVPAFTNSVATDIHNQVNLFVQELNGSESKAGSILRNAKNLDQAMQGMKEYERFGIEGKRRQYAEQILKDLT